MLIWRGRENEREKPQTLHQCLEEQTQVLVGRLDQGSAKGWKEAGNAGVLVSEWWSRPGPANAATSSGAEEEEHALLADLPPVEGTPR